MEEISMEVVNLCIEAIIKQKIANLVDSWQQVQIKHFSILVQITPSSYVLCSLWQWP